MEDNIDSGTGSMIMISDVNFKWGNNVIDGWLCDKKLIAMGSVGKFRTGKTLFFQKSH